MALCLTSQSKYRYATHYSPTLYDSGFTLCPYDIIKLVTKSPLHHKPHVFFQPFISTHSELAQIVHTHVSGPGTIPGQYFHTSQYTHIYIPPKESYSQSTVSGQECIHYVRRLHFEATLEEQRNRLDIPIVMMMHEH